MFLMAFQELTRENRLPIRIITDHAWQSLFARQLFVRPTEAELESHEPEFTVMSLNDFEAIPEVDGTNSKRIHFN